MIISSVTFVDGFLTGKPSYFTSAMSGVISKRALYENAAFGSSLPGAMDTVAMGAMPLSESALLSVPSTRRWATSRSICPP